MQDGSGLDVQDAEGRTPLLWAVDRDEAEIVKYLIGLGAAINHQDTDGETSAHMVRRRRPLVRYTVGCQTRCQPAALPPTLPAEIAVWIQAVLCEHEEILEILLGAGVDTAVQVRMQRTSHRQQCTAQPVHSSRIHSRECSTYRSDCTAEQIVAPPRERTVGPSTRSMMSRMHDVVVAVHGCSNECSNIVTSQPEAAGAKGGGGRSA